MLTPHFLSCLPRTKSFFGLFWGHTLVAAGQNPNQMVTLKSAMKWKIYQELWSHYNILITCEMGFSTQQKPSRWRDRDSLLIIVAEAQTADCVVSPFQSASFNSPSKPLIYLMIFYSCKNHFIWPFVDHCHSPQILAQGRPITGIMLPPARKCLALWRLTNSWLELCPSAQSSITSVL